MAMFMILKNLVRQMKLYFDVAKNKMCSQNP